jgi:peptide deformylase
MAVLEVLTFPDERLRTVAKPVEKVTPEIQSIVDDMIETMYDEEGIGLAATQVNVHQRIVVIDVSDSRDEPMVLINPEITAKSGDDGIEEGCLSVPGARALVPRAAEVSVKALDRDGNEFTFDADDLLAICVQHELDHLEGKLFVDYLSPLKRKRIKDKLEKIKRSNERSK